MTPPAADAVTAPDPADSRNDSEAVEHARARLRQAQAAFKDAARAAARDDQDASEKIAAALRAIDAARAALLEAERLAAKRAA